MFKKKITHETFFNSLRKNEYYQLDKSEHIYLDYTGGNLYSKSQLKKHFNQLNENIFGNPHSTNPTSKFSTQLVEEARQKVLDFFNADDYYCIFTPNATGALKIVGECYPFNKKGYFLLLTDNHNSVNGIREYCNNLNCEHEYTPINFENLSINKEELSKKLKKHHGENKLFAYPAQSNVSGIKHDLKWIKRAQDNGWDVLLDAAAFVPTSKLDLRKYSPNFVSISFYKIFGYPTGLGCLLVHKSSFSKLQKRWFAGGTVSLASTKASFHFLSNNHERFENGTINYLNIPAITIGLDYIQSIGMKLINERIQSLTNYLYNRLKKLKHSNKNNQLIIFGNKNRKNTGGTIIMSFLNPNGSNIPFEKIEELTNKKRISIRSGCFCNPGLDETNNCLTTDEITSYFTTRKTGDYMDMIDYLQKLRGATRVSVGIATNKNDLDAFILFVKNLKDKTINN